MKSVNPKYLAFLASCIAECDLSHTPEEIAAAQQLLNRTINVPQFDLMLGKSETTR